MDELSRLIIRAQNGDNEAFGEIYNLFLQRIFRFIHFSVNDYELSWDLTQNTFLKAWKAIEKFSTKKGSLQAFLFAIARNLVIDWYRKKKDILLRHISEPVVSADFEERLVRDEQGQALRAAINKLEPQDKEIIMLRYFEEMTFAEVAKIVGKREGAVRVRAHRALKSLRLYFRGG